ncbi:MAG: glycosyltransferase [Candidatus Nanopelagicales bacterium]
MPSPEPGINFQHLIAISDERGVFEHCQGGQPRIEHGYCVDDVSRALIVLERVGSLPDELGSLADICLDFLLEAQTDDGQVVNRCDIRGVWFGEPEVRDHWGRALWAWGTSAARSDDVERATKSANAFIRSARQRSPFLRSMAFAALGAGEVLQVTPDFTVAASLLQDATRMVPPPKGTAWPWPEPRLTYANAVIPHMLILGGHFTGDDAVLHRGLDLLEWLVDLQVRDGHLSVIPTGGWAPPEPLPGFDQQPIEVSTLVDACIAAYDVTSDPAWMLAARQGALWFIGENDLGVWMHDPLSGGGFDGLKEDGFNGNRGAESTLAFLSSIQQVLAYRGAL